MSVIPVLVVTWVVGIPLLVGAIVAVSRAHYRRRLLGCYDLETAGAPSYDAPPVELNAPIALEAWVPRAAREHVSGG
jgi:hypothetical protein